MVLPTRFQLDARDSFFSLRASDLLRISTFGFPAGMGHYGELTQRPDRLVTCAGALLLWRMARKAAADAETGHGFNDIIGVALLAFALLLLVAQLSFDPHDLAAIYNPP